jgi:hypothetical protein
VQRCVFSFLVDTFNLYSKMSCLSYVGTDLPDVDECLTRAALTANDRRHLISLLS